VIEAGHTPVLFGQRNAVAAAPVASLLSGARIAPASTDVVAFVGRCLKGPVNEAVVVTAFSGFQQQFGGLWAGSTLPHAVEQFFENGGGCAVVVRVASAARPPTIDLPAGNERLVLTGICPGTNEFLRVSIDHDGISQHDPDLFNLVVQCVQRRGTELVEAQEIFRRVSIYRGSAHEVGRVLLASRLVRLSGRLPSRRPDITRGNDPRSPIGYVDCNHDGDDGTELSDYDLIGSEAARSGLFALQGGPEFSFLYMPPPSSERDLGISALLVGSRFAHAHHALLLIDPPVAWKTTRDALDGIRDWPLHSHDALMFFPRIQAINRLTGRLELFAPSAAAAGLLVRDVDSIAAVWGEEVDPALLRPAAQPSLWVDQLQRQQLALRGVNALRATRTAARDAIALRTLATESASHVESRLLGARRLFLLVSASVERGTRWAAIEGNTSRSRERAVRQVEQFLAQLADAGAFAGTQRGQHYFVFCDERLNGPQQLTEGVFRLVFGYQSQFSAQRQAWLVEHRSAGSRTRPVSLNQLATPDLR
jgi:uncharacterized protein